MKSVFLAYLLWLVGGFVGLHHLYLGRDLQAFLWWCTLGGYFGFGWLRDLFMIPEYVKDVNGDAEYHARLSEKMRYFKKPPFSTLRFGGMMIVSYLFGSVVSSAIPKDEFLGLSWTWLDPLLVPLAGALGVWSVGNIGHEKGTLLWPLLAAYCTYPLYWHYKGDISFSVMMMASALAFDGLSKKWRRNIRPKTNILRRGAILMSCACLYVCLWGCSIYFNGTITDSEGEEIPIHEAIRHFFTSPWWTDLWQSIKDTYAYARIHGWAEVWKMIVELSDPHGEYNAYKVLELDSGANQTVINTRCRQLSMKWHPDKVKDANLKQEAQNKFYDIQQACEILSNNRAKRRRRNKKSSD